jgi:PhzF family phenazine biosynthesis protein
MPGVPLWQVDAFADRPFAGNPAAVCVLESDRDDAWLQAVAQEMNLSETAFLRQRSDGFELRWFTPEVEVDLCGHATLASAHALWKNGFAVASETLRFHTRSGVLTATRRGELIELDFPATPVEESPPPAGLLESLGLESSAVAFAGRTKFDRFLALNSAVQLRQLRPNFTQLASVDTRGVIVTARSDDPRFDFISRFFGPAVGINEDPVTGSAHCALATYWAPRLGKESMRAYQASDRGGVVEVTLRGDRALLAGRAVTVLKGELTAFAAPGSAGG